MFWCIKPNVTYIPQGLSHATRLFSVTLSGLLAENHISLKKLRQF